MLHFGTILIFITCSSISDAQTESRIVTINQGPVRGYKALGREVIEFFGIPYATAPTGSDRFKASLPAPTWTETLDAVENNIGCPQFPPASGHLNIREDCLVANVFMPNTHAANLSVVVYIHGGAFYMGDGNILSPRPLVESQRIVAVTFNYRLGAHGFLCLGTEDIPGNAGLKDMLAALRWVNENIEHFGGNPGDVTLAGYSAGAAAADLLGLSKATEGLFNKLIIDSAAHVAGWNVNIDPIRNAQQYAKILNFENFGNMVALEEFYKTVPYDVLLSDITSIYQYNSEILLAPCIENDLGQERIIDESPLNIIRSSQYRNLPVLYGFGNMEGIFRLPQFDSWAPVMNENFSDFLALDLSFENDTEREAVAQNIKEFYFGGNAVGLYTLFDYINYFTDAMFAYPILRSVKLQNEVGNNQIFLYEYSYFNYYIPVTGIPDVLTNFPGAYHTAQTDAILEDTRNSNEERYTEKYKEVRASLRELWVNYITSGTPVPDGSLYPPWPPANASRSPHMILGDTIELGGALNEQRALLWDAIYDRYYRHPSPPIFIESEHGSNNAFIISGRLILNLTCLFVASLLAFIVQEK